MNALEHSMKFKFNKLLDFMSQLNQHIDQLATYRENESASSRIILHGKSTNTVIITISLANVCLEQSQSVHYQFTTDGKPICAKWTRMQDILQDLAQTAFKTLIHLVRGDLM